jgi:hypothetical protein
MHCGASRLTQALATRGDFPMNSNVIKSAVLLLAGFGAGVLVSQFPQALATNVPNSDLSQKQFLVSIDEVRQNFVFADKFSGHYTKTVTLSDGTTRSIELTPMIHDGMQVVEFKDTGGHTYMGLNGTTTNGKLMVQLQDVATMHRLLHEEGWPGR